MKYMQPPVIKWKIHHMKNGVILKPPIRKQKKFSAMY